MAPRFGGKLVEEETPVSTATKPRFGGKPVDTQEAPTRAWSDVPQEALDNLLPSAKKLVVDTITPFTQPIETVKAIGRLAGGVASKLGIGDFDEATADAVGQAILDRYGSVEAFKNTVATDPVGLLSDIAGVLSGGSLAAARAPGVVGRAAQAAGKVGEYVDPISGGLKAVGAAGRGVGNVMSEVSALTSGTSSDAIRTMQQAGR